jgi:uncharacterized membrane protein
MADLVVVAYPDEQTAERARDKLVELQRQHLITLADAAIAVRRTDGKVKIKQVTDLVGTGALSGAFWGTLIGLIFLVPLLGMALGAAAGALSSKAIDIGVNDQFIKEVGETLQPGTSALFLLEVQVTPDRVLEEMKPFGGTIVRSNLSREQEAQLREAFTAV